MFTSLESSNNGYDHTKVWTVKSTKNGQKFDLTGSVDTGYANENNYFNMLPYASSNTTRELTCPSHFYAASLTKDYKVTMNGTVDEKNANILWYFTDQDSGWSVVANFTGTWWDGGAKLDMAATSAAPATSGEAERVECDDCEDNDDSFVEKHEKKIVGGAVVGGIIVLAAIGVGAWFLLGWWKKRHYQETRQIDDHDAWAMDDHHDEGVVKGGASTGLRTLNTSYDAHRSHSPDPTMAAGFEYKDSYTPLK
jgi:hypothetical protein